MNHITIGVYTSGRYKINIVLPDDLDRHIEYNSIYRHGRMLFVDREYKVGGPFIKVAQDKIIKIWEEKIKQFQIDS